MSLDAMSWAFKQNLPAAEKLVLLSLADHFNGTTGLCIPGQRAIAEQTSMSVRTIQRHLKQLERRGLIARKARFRGEGRGRTSDRYTLAMGGDNVSPYSDDDATKATNQDDQGDTGVRAITGREPEVLLPIAPPVGGSPDGSQTYAKTLVERLDQKGITIDQAGDRDAAYGELLVKALAALPDEKNLTGRLIGDYLTACDIRMDRKGWAIIGRNLKAKQPLVVFDAVAEAVRWGAGTGDYESDPASFAKYVAGILGKKR